MGQMGAALPRFTLRADRVDVWIVLWDIRGGTVRAELPSRLVNQAASRISTSGTTVSAADTAPRLA
jgi:hypothetical protein